MSAFEVVTTRTGARAMRDLSVGELMHPVGPLVEAQALYVGSSRLQERLRSSGAPLTLFDVGLGAGSNALAAWRCAQARAQGRRLHILSFDRTAEALRIALLPEHAPSFGLEGEGGDAARALLDAGAHQTERATWRLILGELPASLERAELMADLVFWDPFSPLANPSLWTVAAFSALRRRCGPLAMLYTYSAATSVRAALLLSGFAVGQGASTGEKRQTTEAAVRPEDLAMPLDRRWLERLGRSSAPLPEDAPPEAMEKIWAMAQFTG